MRDDGTAVTLGAAALLAGIGLIARRRRGSADSIGQRRWFHGTDAKNVDAILRDGIAGASPQRKGWFAPLPGRAYLSSDLGYSLIYALGGNMVGTDLSSFSTMFPGRGAIVELTFNTDDDVIPDEDWLGECLAAVISRRRHWNNDSTDWDWLDGECLHYARRCQAAVSVRTSDQLGRAERLDEAAVQARIGKRVIRELSRTKHGRALLLEGASIASSVSVPAGSVRIASVWTFDKMKDNAKLKRDGSNFFSVGKKVWPKARRRRGSADRPTFVVRNPKQGLDLIRHPDIVANFEKGLRWRRKHATAVLVPCAGTKPFPQSPSHKHGYLAAFEGQPVDLWVVSEPLGVVPYAFSRTYPNDAYDFPPEHLKGKAHDELAKRVATWFDRKGKTYSRIVAALPAHHQKLVDKALGLAKGDHRIERAGVGVCRSEGACSSNTFRATTDDYKRYLKKKGNGSKNAQVQQRWRYDCRPDEDKPFFHATTWDRLEGIAEDGLCPHRGARFGGWYAGHSVGKVFVTQGDHSAVGWWSAVDRISDQQELRQQEDLDRVVVVMLRIDMKGIVLRQDKAGSGDIPCSFYTGETIGSERIWFYDGSNDTWRPIDEWDESDPTVAIAHWQHQWEQDDPDMEPWINFSRKSPYGHDKEGAFSPPAYQVELFDAGWDEQMESW